MMYGSDTELTDLGEELFDLSFSLAKLSQQALPIPDAELTDRIRIAALWMLDVIDESATIPLISEEVNA